MNTKTAIAVCDHCGRGTNVIAQVRKYGQGRQETYFDCDQCGHSYTAYVTDGQVRKWQRQLPKIKDSTDRLLHQAKIKQRMDELKDEL